MPVDNTRVISPRRTQKKLTEEELKDIDRKRLLGELSCAECRRLKLRCDKKLPCGSCYRRGCESICPLGILAAGQGTRFILADTEQLHEKIYEMSNRIRQLEDALAILQSTVSDQRHPLLTDELLKIKFGSEAINARELPTEDKDNTMNKSIDALGTLTLGSSGEMQYFGRSAGSETLMMRAGEEADGSSDEGQEGENTPHDHFLEIEKLANVFPFSTRTRPNLPGQQLIQTFLPPYDRAYSLCLSYIDHGSYFFRPIKRDELLGGLLASIYNNTGDQAIAGSHASEDFVHEGYTPHALATLFFVFALGCLLDLSQPPYNSEAELYYDLGRASLSLRPIYDSPNMDCVQAMGLMATYHSLAGKKYSRDSAWCAMSFAAKLAQSIGLHRDSARWNMDPTTVEKRRNLFWEVFSADVSHSLALGRPPAIHLSYVDCEFPSDDDPSLGSDSVNRIGFWRMKHMFARNIYNSVADATLIAKSPSYNTILDLDRKVREISFPASFNPYVTREEGLEKFHSSSISLRDFYASQHRTVTMIYLHRSFFAQAMLDHPNNPLLSPFAPSFLTAYRSASVIIKASAHLFERCAEMAMRLWFLMYHTFSAAVIVGTVVTRSPNSSIASIAMRDFNVALALFEKTALQSQRAKIALGVLLKLQEKAKRAYEQYNATGVEVTATYSSTMDELEDDLAIFGGQMRVLDRKGKQSHQKSSSISGSGSTATAPSGSGTGGSNTNTASNPGTAASSAGSASQSPASTPSSSVSPVMPHGTPANMGLGLGLNSMGLDMPDVHPSLITYLNQDAVRRAVQAGQGASTPMPQQQQQASPVQAFAVPTQFMPQQQQQQLEPSTGQERDQAGGNNLQNTSSGFVFPPPPSMPLSRVASSQAAGGGVGSHTEWSPFNTFGDFNSRSSASGQGSRSVFGNLSVYRGADQAGSGTVADPSSSQNSVNVAATTTTPGGSVGTSITQGFGTMPSMYSGPNNPLSHHQAQSQQQQHQYAMNRPMGDFNAYMYAVATAPSSDPYVGGNSSSNNAGLASPGWIEGAGTPMDTAGAVDIGLSGESRMEAGWVALMRDYGIMDSTGG